MKTLITLFSIILTLNSFALEELKEIKKEQEILLDKKFILLPHKGSFLIPFSYNLKPNSNSYKFLQTTEEYQDRGKYNRNLETEFQVSFMLLTHRDFFNTGLNIYLGYTQQSWWQLYNDDWSKPFRETNYAPEIFARKMFDEPKSFLGGKLISYDFGFIHQSNGQIQELSRSWNRGFLRSVLVYGNTLLKTTLWHRVFDSSEKTEDNNNRDIYDYLGYGEIEIDQVWTKSRLQLRIIPGLKKQGVEVMYSYPWHEGLRYFVKLGYGSGLSLIDYKSEGQKIGVGVVLSDLFSN
jgi:phospholipase A1